MIQKVIFIALLSFSLSWKPFFTGHRGSYTGVENTVESYTNGVEMYHYQGLECDVRVTKDGQYVSNHNEEIKGDKGTMIVKDHTLEELKSNLITQTRGGKTYTGHICTMDEYLSICKVKNVVPVIELKSAVGINQTDMSNFPGLDEKVKSYGLQDKAIYISFQSGSVEYIRKNYPTYKVQYLMNSLTAGNLEFCKKWNVNPSINNGGFNKSDMQKLKDAGLDGAVWCVNSKENYMKFAAEVGVYMMTCDYLMPDEMPEVDYPWLSALTRKEKFLNKRKVLKFLDH